MIEFTRSRRELAVSSGRAFGRFLRYSIVLDLAIVITVALFFAWPILNFDDSIVPAATDDWEDNTASFALARDSILNHAELPLWNPYFGTGTPYLAEPHTVLLNPIATVPSLVLGPLDGSKVAAALSIVVAGLGMYYLAAAQGVSRPLRIWAALLLVMSGVLAGRLWAGHFNLLTGFAYVPLVFALAIDALRRPGIVFPILAGLANALLLFSGQLHYTVYAAPGLLLIAISMFIWAGWRGGRWSAVDASPVLWRGLAIVGWTFGFAAIQLFPYIADRSLIDAPIYDFTGAQTIFHSAENLFTSDILRLSTHEDGRARWGWWEYYYYVGPLALLGVGMALAVPALLQRERRAPLVLTVTLFWLYLSWSAAPHTSFQWVYSAFPPLHHLRVPSRTLAFATPFLILLSAIGFDWALQLRGRIGHWRIPGIGPAVPWGALAALALLAFAFYGLLNIFNTNRAVFQDDRPRHTDRTAIMEWLREHDGSVFYVTEPRLGQAVPAEMYELGIKRLDATWEYSYRLDPGLAPKLIFPKAKYVVAGEGDPPPDSSRLIANIEGRRIYEQFNSPYYASTIVASDPTTDDSFAWRLRTNEAASRIVSANVIEVQAAPLVGQDRLLVFEAHHPGWRLEIDGERAERPQSYGGYLSTPALPGTHTYTFVFDPASVRYGAAVTLGTILGSLLLVGWRRLAGRSV
ncbi:MAG: hypothetical protein IID41_00785 [Planctomycetes bacterium]|nr:hypothetical protein [Planctomycetota bacterium]